MQLTSYFSRLKSDSVIWGVMVITAALLSGAFTALHQNYIVSQRSGLIDQNYGKNLLNTSRQVSQKLTAGTLELELVSEQQNATQLLRKVDSAALNEREAEALVQFPSAGAIYYIDENLVRHQQELSAATKTFARQTIEGLDSHIRAVRIDGDWKLLTGVRLSDTQGVVGLVLLQQALDPLSELLNGGDLQQGALHLEQIEANQSVTRLLTIGDDSLLRTGQDNNNGLHQRYPIHQTRWQLTFEPSELMADTLQAKEMPFWYGASIAGLFWLIGIHLLIVGRGKRSDSEISIFTNQSQDVRTIRLPAQKEPQQNSQAKESDDDQPEGKEGVHPVSANQHIDDGDPEDDEFDIEGLEDVEGLDDIEAAIAAMSDDELPASMALEEDHSEDEYSALIDNLSVDDDTFVLPDLVFRDYDIRGVAGEEITEEFARRLGKTVGSLVLRRGNSAIYLGRDGRSSSNELTLALREGLLSTGCNVIDLGEIITPALNFAINYSGQSSCGIMVTASHNPGNFNGFKIIVQGQVLSGDMLQLLKPIMIVENFTRGVGEYFSRVVIPQYVRQIFEDIGIVREFKIVVDGANSVSGPVAVELFESLGCEVVPLYCDIDGSFPNHEPNPSDEFNLLDLRARVASEDADLGFAFDGDGDRLVVITGAGKICWPDKLMMLFARDILQTSPGASIVYDVKSSQKLAEIIRQNKGEPVMCKTGHSHVRKAVQEVNAPLGGEFSGHIFFNDRRKGFDDGLYAAARLLEILTATYKNLDQLLDELDSSVYTGEILIPVNEQDKFALMRQIANECEFKGTRIMRLDGLRVEYPQGWGLIRASNTSANLTLRFEADDHNILGYIKQTFKYKLSGLIPNIEDYL